MEFKFDKGGAAEVEAPQAQEKGRQTLLLAVLVILLGSFGYLYFFTDIIRPQEKAPAPQPVPQVVKKALPARDGAPALNPAASGQAAAPAAVPGQQQAAAKPAAGAVPPPAAGKPEEKKPVVAAKPEPPKPAQNAVKQPEPKPVDAAKPEAPKSPAVKPEPAKAAAVVKTAPQKQDDKKATAVAAGADKKTAAVKPDMRSKAAGPWTLTVGSYVVEEALAGDMTRVKAAGLTPVIGGQTRHATAMHRLMYGVYPDRAAADQAIEQVKRLSGTNAFSVQKGTQHEVFVGSYSLLERAKTEQQRLAAAGVKVTIQKAQVRVPARKLTAGVFADRKAAEAALAKLKKAGIGTPVLE